MWKATWLDEPTEEKVEGMDCILEVELSYTFESSLNFLIIASPAFLKSFYPFSQDHVNIFFFLIDFFFFFGKRENTD